MIVLAVPPLSFGQLRAAGASEVVSSTSDSLSSDPARLETPRRTLGLGGGMGVSTISSGEVVDYMNSLAAPSQRIEEFGTAVEFFISPEYQIGSSWGLKAEYAYLLKSHNVLGGGGIGSYDFTYSVHMPTLIFQYLIIREEDILAVIE